MSARRSIARMPGRSVPALLAALVLVASSTWGRGGSASAEPVSITSLRVDEGVYLALNDLLRPLGASRRTDRGTGVTSVWVQGQEVRLLADSRLVHGATTTWQLARPVRVREGGVWVPEEFVRDVLARVATIGLTYQGGYLFVGESAARVDSLTVRRHGDGAEIIFHGFFPDRPTATAAGGALDVLLTGCFATDVRVPAGAENVIESVDTHRREDGTLVILHLTDDVDGYAWRERAESRLRLLVGDRRDGLAPLRGEPPTARRPVMRIVVDAGHGGRDVGVPTPGRGGRGEKWFTLDLARALADRLLDAGFEVTLTRNEDRDLALADRAAVANAVGGDLFISLELDAYPSSTFVPVRCAVHRPLNTPRAEVVAGYRLVPWTAVQAEYLDQSRAFGQWILRETTRGDRAGEDVRQVPLKLLEGVDMPAVAVLVAARLTETRWERTRDRLADEIGDAVEAFAGTEVGR